MPPTYKRPKTCLILSADIKLSDKLPEAQYQKFPLLFPQSNTWSSNSGLTLNKSMINLVDQTPQLQSSGT